MKKDSEPKDAFIFFLKVKIKKVSQTLEEDGRIKLMILAAAGHPYRQQDTYSQWEQSVM